MSLCVHDILNHLEVNEICTHLLSIVIFVGFDSKSCYATPQNYGARKLMSLRLNDNQLYCDVFINVQ